MEIDENSYILGYWFASDENDNCWYLMMQKKDGEWIGRQTFRYNIEHSDPFSGKDEKEITTIKPKRDLNEEEILNIINDLFEIVKVKYNNFSDSFLVRGNAEKFMDIAKTKSYMHIKVVQ